MQITSLQNPRVKNIIKLRDRKHREAEGVLLVEGRAEVSLALKAGESLVTVFCCPALTLHPEDAALLQALQTTAGVELVPVSGAVFAKLAYRDNPDGWLAVARARRYGLDDLRLGPAPLLLVCEAVEKPGNLGAMLRTADAAGADALIVCDPATDLGNPNVVRASRGALFTVPVAEAEGATALAWLKARHIQIVAATPQAEQIYTRVDVRGPVAIAVGAEDAGLSAAWLQQADLTVRIPMTGQVNSLNVAASAALLLYEAVRQRSAGV